MPGRFFVDFSTTHWQIFTIKLIFTLIYFYRGILHYKEPIEAVFFT